MNTAKLVKAAEALVNAELAKASKCLSLSMQPGHREKGIILNARIGTSEDDFDYTSLSFLEAFEVDFADAVSNADGWAEDVFEDTLEAMEADLAALREKYEQWKRDNHEAYEKGKTIRNP